MAREFWKHRAVLVTGANGFIGAELCAELAKRKALVTGMVHDASKQFNKALPLKERNFHYVRGSVADLESTKNALRFSGAKTIFHLAANPSPKVCEERPVEAYKTNVLGTLNVLEAARTAKEKPEVILASSYYVYAKKRGRFSEEDALGQETVYGTTKAIAEQIAESYGNSFGTRTAIARFGAVFGKSLARNETLASRAISGILRGSEIELNAEDKKRDYVFLADAVNALLLLGEKCREKAVCGEAFNFTYGKPTAPSKLIEIIARIEGKNARTKKYRGAREYDMASDSSKARKVLGWKPAFKFEKALKETIEWHREQAARRKRI